MHLPVPGVSGTVLIVIFRRPAKDVLCLFDGGKAQGHVARARADDAVRHLPARCLFKRGHQLQHGRPLARSQIENVIFAVRFFKIVQRRNVPLCQIDNVDVVADPRSVRGIVLIAVNAQIRELPEQGAGDVGGKVVWGLLTAVLADEPGGMCADGVEVAQRGKAEVVALPREIMQEQLDLRVVQIVGNDNVIAGVQKLYHRVASDKARAAGHQYRHDFNSSLFRLFSDCLPLRAVPFAPALPYTRTF